MVLNETIHAELRQRFNRVNSNFGEKMEVEDWDRYFNSGYRSWVKNRAVVAKTNSKVRFDLQKLERNDIKIDIIDVKDKWIVCRTPEDYYTVLSLDPIATRDGCSKPRELTVTIVQANDWKETHKDPNWTPSFLWGRTLANEVGAGIKIGRVPEMAIISVTMDYYRVPNPIYSPELKDCDYSGALKALGKSNIPFELDDMQADEIYDFAVYVALRDAGDVEGAASQWSKIQNLLSN